MEHQDPNPLLSGSSHDADGAAPPPKAPVAMYYVEIVAYEGDQVVERMGPLSEGTAERVADGTNINLNHMDYFVQIVDEDGHEVASD